MSCPKCKDLQATVKELKKQVNWLAEKCAMHIEPYSVKTKLSKDFWIGKARTETFEE